MGAIDRVVVMPLLQGALGILVSIVAFILVWKIFKKLLAAVVLVAILLLLLWYFGFLL